MKQEDKELLLKDLSVSCLMELNELPKEILSNNPHLVTKELIEHNQKQIDLIMQVKRKI